MKLIMHQKESRAESLHIPCKLDDDQLGRNMLWNKAERNIETWRILIELHKDGWESV
jgi:hypothetical protein